MRVQRNLENTYKHNCPSRTERGSKEYDDNWEKHGTCNCMEKSLWL